ncbi:2-hydroxyacid dehydrogenase [Reinekea thalattae]|uniref:Glyoxylate/hydroxypyruvate reductase A n=1 Tax=Reinekea thalattae TaxID=2593301 RepID=A0A5C8ZAW0_9GAMM|nr:glyoxylate/hydroxypyruvate reductase A [Reinekea thalattae]TXR54321.1 glyoxylate/hydroxypyruvate reductase A [Reinekea thalattae]
MSSIVFIHSLSADEQQQWLLRFKQLLPAEQIFIAEELSDQQAAEMEIAIVANPSVDQLKRFPKLVWLQSLWAGVESVLSTFESMDVQAKASLPKLSRLIDPQLAETMSEAVLAWTLYLHRQMPAYRVQQEKKQWQQLHCPPAQQVTVSVLGAGELGASAMTRLAANGFNVYGWSRTEKDIPGVRCYSGAQGLSLMLGQTNILICLLPLTKATEKLVNKSLLSQLPKGARFINFARGGVADYDQLIELLDEGHLDHAVLDVFEQEPLQPESVIWQHEKITVLPHISAATNIETASQIVAKNILNYRKDGTLPELVDIQRGY